MCLRAFESRQRALALMRVNAAAPQRLASALTRIKCGRVRVAYAQAEFRIRARDHAHHKTDYEHD